MNQKHLIINVLYKLFRNIVKNFRFFDNTFKKYR